MSTGDEASRFARFSFRRHFFQHLGFRLARSVSPAPPPVRLCRAEVFVLGAGATGKLLTHSARRVCVCMSSARCVCVCYVCASGCSTYFGMDFTLCCQYLSNVIKSLNFTIFYE